MSATDTGRGGVDRRGLLKGGAGAALLAGLGSATPARAAGKEGCVKSAASLTAQPSCPFKDKIIPLAQAQGFDIQFLQDEYGVTLEKFFNDAQSGAGANTTSTCSTIRGSRNSARRRCWKTSAPGGIAWRGQGLGQAHDRHGLLATADRGRASKASRGRRQNSSACRLSATSRPSPTPQRRLHERPAQNLGRGRSSKARRVSRPATSEISGRVRDWICRATRSRPRGTRCSDVLRRRLLRRQVEHHLQFREPARRRRISW